MGDIPYLMVIADRQDIINGGFTRIYLSLERGILEPRGYWRISSKENSQSKNLYL